MDAYSCFADHAMAGRDGGYSCTPFWEAARSAWLAVRFAEAGLWGVEIDAVGNVFGAIPAKGITTADEIWRGPVVLLTAHVDTVFPAGTSLIPNVDGDRLEAPGACDNGAGVAGMLGLLMR